VPAARGAAGLARKETLVAEGKMHADEVRTDASLVGRLLAAQFPRWADLPIRPFSLPLLTQVPRKVGLLRSSP